MIPLRSACGEDSEKLVFSNSITHKPRRFLMRTLAFILTLLAVFSLPQLAYAVDSDDEDSDYEDSDDGISLELESEVEVSTDADLEGSASAEGSGPSGGYSDSDDGPVLMLEFTSLDLPEDDDMSIFRMIAGWTFDYGIQFGANLTFHNLDRPSVNGVVFVKPPETPYPQEPEKTYTLDDSFVYWGFGPFLGFDVELIEGWLGLEFIVTPTFPVTNDSSGWSIEVSSYAYFSFEGMSDDWFDVALMGGLKYGHYDVEADRYQIEEDQMMPAVGVMVQF